MLLKNLNKKRIKLFVILALWTPIVAYMLYYVREFVNSSYFIFGV